MSMRLPRAAIARVPGHALHRFKMEEPHATPHDHPWSFDTKILDVGYVGEVFHLDASRGWHSELDYWFSVL